MCGEYAVVTATASTSTMPRAKSWLYRMDRRTHRCLPIVTRSKLFVRERFGKIALIHVDTMEIETNIEHTRFPVPEDEQHSSTADYPGLLRAADLIGQMADVNYLRKTPALFAEFRETGIHEKLGFRNAQDLRSAYPRFFWSKVNPYIGDALAYLRVTQEGKFWIANLYAHVFSEEHRSAIRTR